MSGAAKVRTLAEAALWLESQGLDPECGTWDAEGGALVWEDEPERWRFVGVQPSEGNPLGEGLSPVLDAVDLYNAGVRRLLASTPDPTLLRPATLAQVLQNLHEALACAEQAERLLEAGQLPLDEDGTPLLGLPEVHELRDRVVSVLGPLHQAERLATRGLTLRDLPLTPGTWALPAEERALLPTPPCPVEVMEPFFTRGWTLVDDRAEERPGQALLRHPSGATLWIGGDDTHVEVVELHEGRQAQDDELALRMRPSFELRRTFLRRLTRGTPVTEALRELTPLTAGVRHLGTTNAGDDRTLAFFEVTEARPYDRVWLLALLTAGDGGLRGRYVLTGEAAWDQRHLLDALRSPEGAMLRARALAAGLGAALADVLQAFAAPGADLRALTDLLRPQPGDAGKVFVGQAAVTMESVVRADWADAPPLLQPDAGQTEVRVAVATGGMLAEGTDVEEFPGGWRAIGHQLRPESVWATAVFCQPGQVMGRRFDGLVCIGDRWAWFPKAWRALRDAT
jgi:hypothetical protein